MPMSLQRAERLFRRAMGLHQAGMLYHALKIYHQILNDHPSYPPALHHAALATQKVRKHARAQGIQFDEAAELRLIVRAVEAATQIAAVAEAHHRAEFWAADGPFAHGRLAYAAMVHNYAKFQMDRGILDGPDGARVLFEFALQVNPELGEGWTNLGNVYGGLGNRVRSDAAFDRALRCPAIEPETKFNLSFLHLMRGDYERGWQAYEARWDAPEFLLSYGRSDLSAARWNGEQFDGTLYLHGEQGGGDVIMMARYIPLVRARVTSLVVEVLEGLVTYFRATFPELQVVARGDDPPQYDAQLPMMSLPAVFGTSIATVPPPIPTDFGQIRSEPDRIGLCWKGSATHVNDRTRSMPVTELAPLLAVAGYTWQSLQYGVDDVAGIEPLISTDYLDTARVIASCGLVITVDTSIAHLAATLGVETWVLLPHHAEWRWMQDKSDTPWYPRATLWRQRQPGNWTEMVMRLRERLKYRRVLENSILYGNPHGPVHGPTPRGILSDNDYSIRFD